MLRSIRALHVVARLCLLAMLTPAAARAHAQPRAAFAPGELLVRFAPDAQSDEVARIRNSVAATTKRAIPELGVEVLDVPPGQELQLQRLLVANPAVELAELNGRVSIAAAPNDPRSRDQWQYNNTGQTGGAPDADIDAFEGWSTSLGDPSVAVAVLDTGIDQNHEDLAGKVAKNANFTDSPTVDDLNGHGTHVAGIVAAGTNNGKGVAGTCPRCSLLNVKVLDDGGSGYFDWFASGIVWAADNGARVINMSFGCSGTFCETGAVAAAVDYAWSKGVVVVAAAGNYGSSDPYFPAYYANAIAVASTDDRDALAATSDYGSWVDVAAPGEQILSTTNNGGYGLMSGTSMAAPHVAGLAGLIWATGSCADAACVRRRIESTAEQIPGTRTSWTYGRINLAAGVANTPGEPGDAPNMVPNPGMELDANGDGRPDGWSASGSVARSNAAAHGGSYALRHRATSNVSYTIYSDTIRPVTPGAGYTVSAWVNIPATSDSFSFSLVAAWKDSASKEVATTTIRTLSAATGGWQNVRADLVAPAGSGVLTLRQVVGSLNATIYVDDLSFSAAVTPVATNRVVNPGMELDANGDGRPDGWSASGSVARSNAAAHGGSYALRHRATSNASYTIYSDTIRPVTPGAGYTVSAWVNIPATSDSFSFSLVAAWKDAGGTQLATSTIKTYRAATGSWNEARGSVVAPRGAAQLLLRMVVSSLNATIYVDDVAVSER